MNRLFIVEPQYEDDHNIGLFKVCSTTSKNKFLEIYWKENYDEVESFNDRASAINYCKSKGYNRVKII